VARSPACLSCGRRSLRYRKRTEDFVCRSCGRFIPAVEVRAEHWAGAQIRRLRPASRLPMTGTRGRTDLAGLREVARALADMEAACNQLDLAVGQVCKRHEPLGCLPLVLAMATGAIVAALTTRSVRWYFAVVLSFGGVAVAWVVLMLFLATSWSRQHPLLARMHRLKQARRNDEADGEFLDLGEAIVRHYLPPNESASLLVRLEDAKKRAARLLGIVDEEPSPPGPAGAQGMQERS